MLTSDLNISTISQDLYKPLQQFNSHRDFSKRIKMLTNIKVPSSMTQCQNLTF